MVRKGPISREAVGSARKLLGIHPFRGEVRLAEVRLNQRSRRRRRSAVSHWGCTTDLGYPPQLRGVFRGATRA
jgi:hypothetical protein